MSTLVVLQCGFLWLLSQNYQICDFQPHLFEDNKLWAKNTIFHSTSIHWRSHPREVAAVFAYIQSVSAFAGDDTSALSCFISFVRIFMPCFYDGESFLADFGRKNCGMFSIFSRFTGFMFCYVLHRWWRNQWNMRLVDMIHDGKKTQNTLDWKLIEPYSLVKYVQIWR